MKCYAKINLALNVTNKSKPKGYHDLDMINFAISLHDNLRIKFIKDDKNITTIECDKENVPTDGSNLICRVIEAFKKQFHLSFSALVKLTKNIPQEAGLGGGSSNAAKTLDILDRHFKTHLSIQQKINFLAPLTADGPFFVLSTPSRVKGIGEKVYPLQTNFKGKILLIKPKEGCSTKNVYNSLNYETMAHPNLNKIESALKENDKELLAKHIGNSLLESAGVEVPHIKFILEDLKTYGFEIIGMSGSGSCCFAMSSRKEPYKEALEKINKDELEILEVYKLINKKKA